MAVLGEMKASVVVHLAGVLSAGTMLTCYLLAVHYHHVPLWLPMISDCAIAPPEMFLFRFGLLSAAWFMALENVVIYLASASKSLLALGFGVVASLCVGVVSVVNEDEASKIHGTCAVIFFLFYWINMVLLTGLSSRALLSSYCPQPQADPRKPLTSGHLIRLVTRLALTVFVGIALVMAAVVSIGNWDKNQIHLAICEWSGTFAILAFNWSYLGDLGDIRIAELVTGQEPAIQNKTEK